MKGYFLGLARLALGTAPRVEPRTLPQWEGGWIEGETEVATSQTTPGEDRIVERPGRDSLTTVHEIESSNPLVVMNETNESHHLHQTDQHTHLTQTAETLREVTNLQTAEIRETKETLRELAREARIIRERTERETLRETTERPYAVLPEAAIERRTEIERLVREVERTNTAKTTVETNELTIETAGPAIEIRIGRIDVRAPAPTATERTEKTESKPKGVIELDDYLRERSRGNL